MKQYIILDLEATCWERPDNNNRTNEIIEIGAVKLDENANQVDTYQTFIKPTMNPILSEFCVKLTSIQQAAVDNAPDFKTALMDFEKWICHESTNTALVSWGYYDKNQLLKECQAKDCNGSIRTILDNHHSIKHDFAKIKNIKACGMGKALNILGMPLVGTHHRGIDDALNISKIFKAVFDEWILL